MFQSKRSSPRPCATSSNGLLNPPTRTGISKCETQQDFMIHGIFSIFALLATIIIISFPYHLGLFDFPIVIFTYPLFRLDA